MHRTPSTRLTVYKLALLVVASTTFVSLVLVGRVVLFTGRKTLDNV